MENQKLREGANVIFTGKIKMLDEGTIGILHRLHTDWCTIIYPQNNPYESDGNGGWKPRKIPSKVYAHTAKLTEIKLV